MCEHVRYNNVHPGSGRISHKESSATPNVPTVASEEHLPLAGFTIDRTTLRRAEDTVSHSHHAIAEPSRPERPAWLTKALETWKNPVYPAAKRIIPSVESTNLMVTEIPHQMRKESLGNLQFLEQIDCKFLLCRLTTSEKDLLLMIDQHAADERVRVEGFFRTYCAQVEKEEVEILEFKEPKPILVTGHEMEQIRQHLQDFAKWGFKLDCDQDAQTVEVAQIFVKTVPTIVSERLRADLRLLQQLIKRYLVQLSEHPIPRLCLTQRSWTSIVRWSPDLLLDLINSKACRGMQ